MLEVILLEIKLEIIRVSYVHQEFRLRLCQTWFLNLDWTKIIIEINVVRSYFSRQMLEINVVRSYFTNRSGTTVALYKNEWEKRNEKHVSVDGETS
jgi:hypothetical protein